MAIAPAQSGLRAFTVPANPRLPMRWKSNCMARDAEFVFDGDNVRHGLCSDLGFSNEDRSENIRRIAEMVRFFLEAGVIALCAFISPMRDDRQKVRAIVGADSFLEIHCDCSVEICEQRDVKGLYKKARTGLIKKYTGISSPYEAPEHSDLRLGTGREALEDCVGKVVEVLRERGIVL